MYCSGEISKKHYCRNLVPSRKRIWEPRKWLFMRYSPDTVKKKGEPPVRASRKQTCRCFFKWMPLASDTRSPL